MEIAKLGEFGLIRRLTESIAPTQSTTLKGVGDDCAVIAPTEGEVTLVTTDADGVAGHRQTFSGGRHRRTL